MRAPHLNNVYSLLQNTISKVPSIYKARILNSLTIFFHISLEHTCEFGKRQIYTLSGNGKYDNAF